MILMVELRNESIDSSLNSYSCKSFRLRSLLICNSLRQKNKHSSCCWFEFDRSVIKNILIIRFYKLSCHSVVNDTL